MASSYFYVITVLSCAEFGILIFMSFSVCGMNVCVLCECSVCVRCERVSVCAVCVLWVCVLCVCCVCCECVCMLCVYVVCVHAVCVLWECLCCDCVCCVTVSVCVCAMFGCCDCVCCECLSVCAVSVCVRGVVSVCVCAVSVCLVPVHELLTACFHQYSHRSQSSMLSIFPYNYHLFKKNIVCQHKCALLTVYLFFENFMILNLSAHISPITSQISSFTCPWIHVLF